MIGTLARPIENWKSGAIVPASDYVRPDESTSRRPLASRFAAQVATTPDRYAVVTDDEAVTYEELNRRANAVASALLELGAEPTGIVPLLLAHGVEKIVAALGATKAGLAWVPLDDAQEDQDVARLIGFLEAPIVLADASNRPRIGQANGPRATILEVGAAASGVDREDLSIERSRDAISDICFTSGSTDTPKAVVRTERITRYNVDRLIVSHGLGAGDRVAFHRNFWTASLFSALCSGACLCPFDLKRDGLVGMRSWLRRRRISVYNGIVTGFRQFLACLEEGDRFDAMRFVALVGEPLYRADILRFDRHFPTSCALKHYYACTEQVRVSEFTVDRKRLPADFDSVPIGYPLEGIEVLLVDDDLQPVPEGEAGEIAVGGDFLSEGYWRDPERTAKT